MSSISSAAFTPPKPRLLDTIASKAETGQISGTDKTALDSAVETIDGNVPGGSGSSKSARLDPSQMKSRIDGLIGDAVSNGTLTDDQATTLKALFSQGPAGGGRSEVGAAGGPPPGPPPADGRPPAGSDDRASDDASTDTTSVTDLLSTFMKQLQATQGQGSAYTAGGAGSGSGSRIASALLVNFEA